MSTATEKDQLISAVVDRASALYARVGSTRKRQDIYMDILAVEFSCPLDLAALLAADDSNFAHDIGGIARHLNHETFKLEDCFRPRFALLQ